MNEQTSFNLTTILLKSKIVSNFIGCLGTAGFMLSVFYVLDSNTDPLKWWQGILVGTGLILAALFNFKCVENYSNRQNPKEVNQTQLAAASVVVMSSSMLIFGGFLVLINLIKSFS